jgi:homoserine O-acetyltransferase
MLVIKSPDDERKPQSLGVLEAAMTLIENGKVHIIPASPETRGHARRAVTRRCTAKPLADVLAGVPSGAKSPRNRHLESAGRARAPGGVPWRSRI